MPVSFRQKRDHHLIEIGLHGIYGPLWQEEKDEGEDRAAENSDIAEASVSTGNVAATGPTSAAPPASLPPADAPRVSSRGRQIKTRWFGDMFGKFDDDL